MNNFDQPSDKPTPLDDQPKTENPTENHEENPASKIVRPNKDESLDVLQTPLKSAQNAPHFGVELEEKKAQEDNQKQSEKSDEDDSGKITVQHYDVGPRFSGELKPDEEVEDIPVPATAGIADLPGNNLPIQKQSVHDNSAIKMTTIALILLFGGLSAGFFGFRYGGQLFKGSTVSADADSPIPTKPAVKSETDVATRTAVTTPTADTQVTANWPVYSNTKYKYSASYPDTWFGQNTSKTDAETVSFTSFKPEATGSGTLSGYKVEIVLQDLKGKTLSEWVDSNNIITGTAASTDSSLTVGGKPAIQQTVSSPLENVSTYLTLDDKVMIISYYAPEGKLTEGKTFYTQILNTIKFSN